MFVIYDKQTTRILKPNKADQFKTQSAAQRQRFPHWWKQFSTHC